MHVCTLVGSNLWVSNPMDKESPLYMETMRFTPWDLHYIKGINVFPPMSAKSKMKLNVLQHNSMHVYSEASNIEFSKCYFWVSMYNIVS